LIKIKLTKAKKDIYYNDSRGKTSTINPILTFILYSFQYHSSNFYYLSEYPIETTKNAFFKGFDALEIDISSLKSTL
jgi:hypothetical protein